MKNTPNNITPAQLAQYMGDSATDEEADAMKIELIAAGLGNQEITEIEESAWYACLCAVAAL